MTTLRAMVLPAAAGWELAARADAADVDADFAGSLPWLVAANRALGDDRLVHVALVDDDDRELGYLALQRTRASWRSGLPGRATLCWPLAELGYGFRPRWLATPAPTQWLPALRERFPRHRLELRRSEATAFGDATLLTTTADCEVTEGIGTWCLAKPGTVADWSASLQGKHRRDLAKYRRDIERGGGRWLDHDAANAEALAACFQLHRTRLQHKGRAAACLTPLAERFYRELATATAGDSQRLTLLEHEGRFVAACLSFVHRRRLKAFVSGWDRSHARWDLGRQVLYHQVLGELARGLCEIDFLGGDLAYKREFGLQRQPTLDVVVHGGPLARLCARMVGGALDACRRVRTGAEVR